MSRPIYCPHFVTTECVTKVLKCMNDEESPAVILYGEVIPLTFVFICVYMSYIIQKSMSQAVTELKMYQFASFCNRTFGNWKIHNGYGGLCSKVLL